ncbi:MAG: tetratricopeptide repeat protein, partial [Gammaproteobacteria bacterium]
DYNIPLLTMEANLLMDADRNDDAAALLDSSIAAFPDDIQLLFLRSVLSTERNDLALMEQDLRKIIELDPTSPIAYNSLGYTLADRTDRIEEAYELIQRAAELSPDDPAVIDSLGWVQYRLGMLAEARENLTRAYELFPDHEVAAHLGEVLWVLGERNEATRVWRNALQMEPNSSPIRNTVQRLNAGTSI